MPSQRQATKVKVKRDPASATNGVASGSAGNGNLHQQLGIAIVHSANDRVAGEMSVAPAHLDANGMVRGASLVAFADELAAYGWDSRDITSLETKVSYFRRSPSRALGAESTQMHLGESSMVWQTSIYEAGGTPIALVTHTFLVHAARQVSAATKGLSDGSADLTPMRPVDCTGTRRNAPGKMRLSTGATVAQRREHIAEAACRVISLHGFAGSSIRAIADEAGLHVPTLYQYVDSKDEILELVFRWLVDQSRLDIAGATEGRSSAREKLHATIGALTWRGNQHRERMGMLNRELKSLSPKARLRVLAEIQTLMAQIAAVIDEGVSSGEFRSVDPLLVANFVDAVVDVWALRQFSIKRIGVEAFEAEVVRFLDAALLCK